MPRIIAGKFRGRELTTPRGDQTRPTSDRTKESMFSILTNYMKFDGISVLELFAGTGSLGLEALSRGAGMVVFVENSGPALKALRANVDKLGVDDDTIVMGQEVEKVLPKLQPVDLVLLDPPYAYEGLADIINHMFENGTISEDGLCVLETSAKRTLTFSPAVNIDSERRYGDTKLWFLKHAAA